MNLGQIRSRVRKVSGFTMPELYEDGDLDSLINEVYLDVCGTEDWPFLYLDDVEMTTEGDAVVDLPWPVRTMSSVSAAAGPLRETTLDELDGLDEDRTGKPELYARLDHRRLLLWPLPDDAYALRLRGWREPAPLSADNDAPVFEGEFHPLLAYETAARLLVEFGDFDRVEGLRGQAADVISRMRVRYLASKDRGLIQMGGRSADRRRWRA